MIQNKSFNLNASSRSRNFVHKAEFYHLSFGLFDNLLSKFYPSQNRAVKIVNLYKSNGNEIKIT